MPALNALADGDQRQADQFGDFSYGEPVAPRRGRFLQLAAALIVRNCTNVVVMGLVPPTLLTMLVSHPAGL
jgi:hypothetical protein